MLHVNMEDNLRVVFVCDELLAGVAAQPPAGPTGGVIPPGYERSFRQALRRLATTGCTTYKGRMLMHIFFTADNWCCSQPGVQDLTTSWRIDQSWNAGGLTDATWQEMMLYVTGNNIDIVCIQSTQWSLQKQWSTHGYWALSAGVGDHGGLLMLLSHRLCSSQDISSTSPVPGHIQHVQCRLAKVSLDILQVYQYTTDVH